MMEGPSLSIWYQLFGVIGIINTFLPILIFAGIVAIFDALRRINNNILTQTEELKKLREELIQKE